jgi:hypothetical protein
MRTLMSASQPFVRPLFLVALPVDLLGLFQHSDLRSCHNGSREGHRR